MKSDQPLELKSGASHSCLLPVACCLLRSSLFPKTQKFIPHRI
ncbi:hypothetical protein [Moorena sp. SIOASIH]|nr:hypothetical protein [Moorena sp. SIOASIH]